MRRDERVEFPFESVKAKAFLLSASELQKRVVAQGEMPRHVFERVGGEFAV